MGEAEELVSDVRRFAVAFAVLTVSVVTSILVVAFTDHRGAPPTEVAFSVSDGIPQQLVQGAAYDATFRVDVPSDWPTHTTAIISTDGVLAPDCTIGKPVIVGAANTFECVVTPQVSDGAVSVTVTLDGGPGMQMSRTYHHTVS